MAIAALICGIFSLMFGLDPEVKRLSSPPVAQSITQPDGTTASIITSDKHEVKYTEYASKLKTDQVIALVFLAAFTYTMVVLCTDIMLTWALLGVAAAVILGMGLFIMNIYYNFLGGLFHFLGTFLPTANAHFYFAIFTIWVILMIAAILYSRFHYIRIEANEVIVVGGMLDKRRRFSTLRMTYTKDAHMSGPEGDMTAARIELFLKPSGDELERAEAYESVVLREQSRETKGSKLIYTTANETYVVTGTPVKIVDQCQRETIGRTLTFNKGADSIVVDGNAQIRTQTKGGNGNCSS